MRAIKSNLLLFLLIGSVVTGKTNSVLAHAIQTQVDQINERLVLSCQFSTGEPVKGALVRQMNEDGFEIKEIGILDSQGKLFIDIPLIKEGNLDIQIDGGQGHKDYLLIPIRSGKIVLDDIV